jgi:outer membrane lipoprotein
MLQIFRKFNLVIITIALLGGCASKPPAAISKIPPENPSLTRVRMDIDSFIGTEVRWGGVISKVENRASHTWIELVRQKLRENGKPRTDDRSDGRFIASFEGFVDPVVYEVGRLLTVVGTIEAKTERPIGEYDYLFPIVTVEGSYLWKAAPEYRDPYYPHPYWYYDLRFYHPGPYHHHHRYH